ncbi:conserved hypothetical protein [uncultured Gammaproteobacteria bacterium]
MMDEQQQPIIVSLLGPKREGSLDLGDPDTVKFVVRQFSDHALGSFHQVAKGELELDEAVERIGRIARGMNDLFLGLSGWRGVFFRPWNTIGQLGKFVCETLSFDCPPDECVGMLLISMATQIMLALSQAPDHWHGRVETLIDETQSLLLGVVPDPLARTRR